VPGNSIAPLRFGPREGEGFVYVGKAGTGFPKRSAQTVRERLEPLKRRTPPGELNSAASPRTASCAIPASRDWNERA
jgi:ATP-dependent DNA ligase